MRFWLILACVALAPARAALPTDQLSRLSEEYWQYLMKRNPTWATYLGDHRYDERLSDVGPRGRMQDRGTFSRMRGELAKIDANALSPKDRITHRVLDRTLATALEAMDLEQHQYDVNQMDGPQTNLLELSNYHPTRDDKDRINLALRLEAIPRYLAQYQDNIAAGLMRGRTQPRIIVERVVDQLERSLAVPVEKSPFAEIVAKSPPAIAARLKSALTDRVRPAFARLHRFLKNEYLPRARARVGISAMPGGDRVYAFLIRKHTTTDLTAREIHAIGLEELAGIHREADAIAKRHGHADGKAFFAAIRKDPKNFSPTREGILERYREALKRAYAALPKAFAVLPKAPCIVKPLEEYRERESPAAYYYSAPYDRSRPAVFYANTYDPPSRPLYNATALTVHEAVPGHHLQIALAQEITGLPMFRREADFTAFTEGWGLYSERLAEELGLYEDDLARAGMLTYQGWRACRLVVDTGMHALGWTREQAIDFMKTNLALSEKEVVAEVERYITWPGQALAYMIGKREIVRLRRDAEAKMGAKFDLKGFHEVVLRNGAIPLSVLAEEVDAWAASKP
jgi:uncharacterized protein (DUF885 family)